MGLYQIQLNPNYELKVMPSMTFKLFFHLPTRNSTTVQ